MSEKLYLVFLHSLWITQKRLHSIFENSQNYQEFFENLSAEKLKEHDFSEKQIMNILERKQKIDKNHIQKKLQERKVKIVTIYDKNYPKLFREVSNPPYMFYLRWSIDETPKIAVVGSRKMTAYWEQALEKLLPDVAKYFVIVSGGAAWCDTKAHEVALQNKNKTLSVIGTGIDVDYPVKNKKLYDTIVENGGGVISIFPIGEPWNPYNFPVRNELVAGLSAGILVVEAGEKSWTLITAKLALDMGKDIFAIPGDIFKRHSMWCNELIKKWSAKCVGNSYDILEEYVNVSSNTQYFQASFKDELEQNIYNTLLLENLTIDELSKKLQIDIPTLSFKLSIMEINKILKRTLWWMYHLN